jgi:hypothetical protein
MYYLERLWLLYEYHNRDFVNYNATTSRYKFKPFLLRSIDAYKYQHDFTEKHKALVTELDDVSVVQIHKRLTQHVSYRSALQGMKRGDHDRVVRTHSSSACV